MTMWRTQLKLVGIERRREVIAARADNFGSIALSETGLREVSPVG